MGGPLVRRRFPARRRACKTCRGVGSLEVPTVIELRVQFEEEVCHECAGRGER